MSFKSAKGHLRQAARGSLGGGFTRNKLQADEAVTEALSDSLTQIESLLGQILRELRAQRGTRGLGPVAEAQPDEGGFLRRWIG